jgi:methionyl-tRNA formyltransferase
MRILFVSGVKLGHECCKSLLERKVGVVGIFCYPGELKDRSGYVDFSALGKKHGVPVFRFQDVNSAEAISDMKRLAPDLILVIGWSSIIGEEILKIPKKGVLGHHPTLLPKHRGNAPIPWTLINGLTRSGVTMFFLEKEIDKGEMAGQKEFDVEMDDDASSIYAKATAATVSLLAEILPKIEKGTLKTIKQDSRKASRWGKRKPEDGIIDWNMMAIYLHNWIRGLTHPYPGAFTFLGDKKLFIWKAEIVVWKQKSGRPGEVVEAGERLLVRAGDGAIAVESLQLEGEEEFGAKEFVERNKIRAGISLG